MKRFVKFSMRIPGFRRHDPVAVIEKFTLNCIAHDERKRPLAERW